MRIHVQFGRAALVSVGLNILMYLGYLLLTSYGVGHKLAMSLLYVVGVTQSFFLMKRWTFRHEGDTRRALARYLSAYALGYLVNFATMLVLADWAGYPHQLVQILNVAVFACMFFLLLRFWVFRSPQPH